MSEAKRALIVGGGIGGMVAAIALQKQGVSVHVVEAARREDQLGTGINLQNNALRALKQVGLLDDCMAAGFPWEDVTNRDKTGKIINNFPLPYRKREGIPGAMGIMRTTFAEILANHAVAAGVKVSYQTKVATLEQDADGVSVTLTNGESDRADVLIAADGVYSQIRAMVFGEQYKPSYAGQGVWRYTIPRPQTLDGFTMFRTEDRHSLGFLPLAPDVAYYFYLESTEKPLWIEKDQAVEEFGKRLAPYEASEVADFAKYMNEGWHVSYRPFDILLMPAPWHKGRVVLLGDAAHSLTPQLTSGGGMAIEDAVVLAEELEKHDDIDAALAAYTDRRYERVKTVFENSLRICELEKVGSSSGEEGTSVFLETCKLLDADY